MLGTSLQPALMEARICPSGTGIPLWTAKSRFDTGTRDLGSESQSSFILGDPVGSPSESSPNPNTKGLRRKSVAMTTPYHIDKNTSNPGVLWLLIHAHLNIPPNKPQKLKVDRLKNDICLHCSRACRLSALVGGSDFKFGPSKRRRHV